MFFFLKKNLFVETLGFAWPWCLEKVPYYPKLSFDGELPWCKLKKKHLKKIQELILVRKATYWFALRFYMIYDKMEANIVAEENKILPSIRHHQNKRKISHFKRRKPGLQRLLFFSLEPLGWFFRSRCHDPNCRRITRICLSVIWSNWLENSHLNVNVGPYPHPAT